MLSLRSMVSLSPSLLLVRRAPRIHQGSFMACINPAWEKKRRCPPPSSKADTRWIWALVGVHVAAYGAYHYVMPRLIELESDITHDRSQKHETDTDKIVRRLSAAQVGDDWCQRNIMMSRHNLEEGRWWTALTYSLLHVNAFHLFCNMSALYTLGTDLLPLVGKRHFLMVYTAGAIGGVVAHCLSPFRRHEQLPPRVTTITLHDGTFMTATSTSPRYPVVVGASAAAFALDGALVVAFPHMLIPRLIFNTPLTFRKFTTCWVLINLAIEAVPGVPIAGMAHIGGLLMGMMFGTLWFRVSGARRVAFLRKLIHKHTHLPGVQSTRFYAKQAFISSSNTKQNDHLVNKSTV